MNTLRYFDFGAARPVLLLIARIAVVLIFIIFGFPKMMGFDGTVQYMASLGAPMPMLAAIIAVVMEVPAAILIVLGFFTRPLAVLFILTRLGGKRQIAQMNLFDYVNSITIGSIAAEMATNLEQWYRPLTAMIVYLSLIHISEPTRH